MKLNCGEPAHPHWRTPFTAKELAFAWWGVAACFLSVALVEWQSPSKLPFTGRWSWVKVAAVNTLGDHGVVLLYVCISIALVVAGSFKWNQHRTQESATKLGTRR